VSILFSCVIYINKNGDKILSPFKNIIYGVVGKWYLELIGYPLTPPLTETQL